MSRRKRNVVETFDPDVSSDSELDLDLDEVPSSEIESSEDISDIDEPSTSKGKGRSRSSQEDRPSLRSNTITTTKNYATTAHWAIIDAPEEREGHI